MHAVNRALHAHHHFTAPNTPQSNGTVERVCRAVLHCCRALLSKFRLQENEWPLVLPIAQSVLNYTQRAGLGNHAPSHCLLVCRLTGGTRGGRHWRAVEACLYRESCSGCMAALNHNNGMLLPSRHFSVVRGEAFRADSALKTGKDDDGIRRRASGEQRFAVAHSVLHSLVALRP